MKSSMTKTSHTGMIIHHAKIPYDRFKSNYNHMKSSMSYPTHTGMIIEHAKIPYGRLKTIIII
jgi:hypothetical protein